MPQARSVEGKIKYIDLRWDDSQYFRLEGAKEIKNEKTEKPKPQEQKPQTQQPIIKEQHTQEQKQEPNTNNQQRHTHGDEILD